MRELDTVQAMLMGWRDNNRLMIRSHGTPDFLIQGVFPIPMTIDSYIQIAQTFHGAFPGWQLEITEPQERENYVRLLLQVSGVHTGSLTNLITGLPAIPPTGRSFRVTDIPVEFFLRDGKVAREVGNALTQQKCMSLYEQLGITLPTA